MVHSANFYDLYQTTFQTYRDRYGEKVCVFLQKGSFYEFYGQEDPVTYKQLNTGKQIIELLGGSASVYPGDGPHGTNGYFWGVPTSVLDKWASKLTKAGWTVVVIDEVKNGSGKVSKREVSKVLSAGTHLEAAESNKTHCVSALWLDCSLINPPKFGVATADLTTGQVFLYEGQATGTASCWHTDDLRHFFQVYPPKELLLFAKNTRPFDEDELRRTFYVPTAPIYSKYNESTHQGPLENATTREDYLQGLFQPKTALPLRTWLRCDPSGSSLQEKSLACLLRFAEDHAPSLAQQLQAPHIWHPTENLQIINNALTQLNLVGGQCVEDLFVTPMTPMGKRGLTATLCSPLASSEKIQERMDQVSWLKDPSKLDPLMMGIYDLSRLHRCIIRGTLQASDVIQLYQSYMSAKLLYAKLEDSPFHKKLDLDTCLSAFEGIFDVSKAKTAMDNDEVGILLNTVGPHSATIEEEIKTLYTSAELWLSNLRTLSKVDASAMYYKPTEKNMFSIHATKTALKSVETAKLDGPYSSLNLKTLTSSGRLEHKQLDTYQETLDALKARFHRIQTQEVQRACIDYAMKTRHVWQPLEEWITHVDISMTMAKTAKKQGWVRPTILSSEEGSSVEIENLRHPLIEVQKRQSKYVTHNISIGDEANGWLLYGMNASGKSSLMKAIGLAVLLAQIGSYVPATAMTLRPFRKIATRILNQDNLWAGLSSFAVEMSELREILSVADNHTLVLGDELCAGTESISGTAIVASGIQHLSTVGARFVLATHLHDLMKLKQITELKTLLVWHLHVEYDVVKDLLIYHRTLRPGSGSSMYGLEVAKALHLPRGMIDSAFEFRRQLLGEDAVKSAWNTSVVRKMCSVCNTNEALEVHHLQERHEASGGRNKDGTALNHIRNLTVLCQSCHDKHHAGSLHVGPVEDTSEGPKRVIVETQAKKKSTFNEEQISLIKRVMTEYPGLTPRLYVFQIQEKHGITISEGQLKTLIKRG
jgi:DNA mismatch repair protein MutS